MKCLNKPLIEEEFMKVDRQDIGISTVKSRISTAMDIIERYDIVDFFMDFEKKLSNNKPLDSDISKIINENIMDLLD